MGQLVHADNGEYLGAEGPADQALEEVGEAADGSNADDESDGGCALPPGGVGEREVVLVLDGTEEELAHNAEDINRGDHDGAAGEDSEYTMEGVGVLKRAYKDGHLCYEARKTGETE